MGMMIEGRWHTDDDVARTDGDGSWRRAASTVRNWVTIDGAAGPTGAGGFASAAGRYHLYAAWNCPWAHRGLLIRALKGLQDLIGVSYAAPRRTAQGWVFDPANGYSDDLFGHASLHELFSRGVDNYTGRVTVPVLWDMETGRMVSNESADIVRMLNCAFAHLVPDAPDFYPADCRAVIDEWNARIYPSLNNGVYRAGFAGSQESYEAAAREVFDTLDAIEALLDRTPYIAGERPTEADIRLFPTLARFDAAYFGAFKCNLRRLIDYPNLWRYARRFYALDGVAGTVDFDIYRRGYNSPSPKRNPYGIVPLGPDIDWSPPD